MSRNTVIGLIVSAIILVALIVGAVVFLLRTGTVTVISNLSSGEADDYAVGYEGHIVATGTKGAVSEKGLEPGSHIGAALVHIPGGTKGRAIVVHLNTAQIEILDGTEKGMKLWIHSEDLQ